MSSSKRKQQSFEYGAIILLCSTAIVKIIGAIFKIPLKNIISELGFGYFSSAYDLFTSIYTLAMAGLPIAISRVVAEHMTAKRYKDVKSSLKITRRLFFITGITGLTLMLLLIYPFVHFTDATGKTVYSLFAIAPSLLFCCVMSTYRGYYEGLRNMYPTALSDIIEALGKLILGYAFAFVVMKYTGNPAYASAAALLGITVGAAASALYLRLRYLIKGDGITKEELNDAPEPMDTRVATKALIMIAIPVLLASLSNSVASLVDVSMVKWQLTKLVGTHSDVIRNMYTSAIASYNKSYDTLTNAELPTFLYGIRGMAFTIYNLIPTITSVLGVSALPVLASSWSLNDKKLVKRNVESTMKFTALIAMPAGMGFLFIGPDIMKLLYSSVSAVTIGGPMMRIYGIAAIFAGMAIPMTSLLQAINKQSISLRNVAIGAGLKVVVNYIFVAVPTLNIQGAAIGTVACYMFIFIANLISIIKYTGVKPNIYKSLFKPFFAGLCCGIATLFVNIGNGKISVIAEICVAAVVYLVALILLNTFEADDVLSLPKGERILSVLKKCKIIR